MAGSYVLYNRYSTLVYEGDKLKIFGILAYNTIANRWEIENPLAFLNGSKDEYISYLTWGMVSNVFGIVLRGTLALFSTIGFLICSVKLVNRLR
jgi:hypothetical protein